MSDVNHTPGPWEVVADQFETGQFQVVDVATQCSIIDSYNGGCASDPSPTEYFFSEANARLIAAAPELLDALVDLLPHAEKAIEELNAKMCGSLYPAINDAKVKRARTAIAKAK